MDYDLVVAFDDRRHSMHVIAEARCDEGDDPRALYARALARIEATLRALARPLQERRRAAPSGPPRSCGPASTAPPSRPRCGAPRRYIRDGDCQQIVLSQRFDAEVSVAPFDVYRALRRVNPSPYLFYLQDGDRALVGSSPGDAHQARGRRGDAAAHRRHAPARRATPPRTRGSRPSCAPIPRRTPST